MITKLNINSIIFLIFIGIIAILLIIFTLSTVVFDKNNNNRNY
jgi:hypothetical protein